MELCLNDLNIKNLLEILDMGYNIDEFNHDGYTLLMLACMEGSIDVVTILVDRGANLNIIDRLGLTALMHSFNHIACARYLIDNGADINLQDFNGMTYLMHISENRKPGNILYAMDNDAKMDLRDIDGNNALMKSVQVEYNKDVVTLLIKYYINSVNLDGMKASDLSIDEYRDLFP